MTTKYKEVYKTNSDVPYTTLKGITLDTKEVVVFEGESFFHKVVEVTDTLENGVKGFEGLEGTLHLTHMNKVLQLCKDVESLPVNHFTYFYEGFEVKMATKLGKNQLVSFEHKGELVLAKIIQLLKKEVKGEIELELELVPFKTLPALYSVTTKEPLKSDSKPVVELYTTYEEALGKVIENRGNKKLSHL